MAPDQAVSDAAEPSICGSSLVQLLKKLIRAAEPEPVPVSAGNEVGRILRDEIAWAVREIRPILVYPQRCAEDMNVLDVPAYGLSEVRALRSQLNPDGTVPEGPEQFIGRLMIHVESFQDGKRLFPDRI